MIALALAGEALTRFAGMLALWAFIFALVDGLKAIAILSGLAVAVAVAVVWALERYT